MKTTLYKTLAFLILITLGQIARAQNWTAQSSGTTANLWQVQFLDANNGYACGNAGTVLKTTDGGTTWTPVNISTTNPVRDIYFVSTTEGWVAVGDENNSASSGKIWHTTNGGTTWIQQTPSTTEARFGVYFSNSTTGWEVGSRNGPINIDATTNGGSTWVNQSDNNIFGWLYKIDAPSTTTAYAIGGAFFPSVTGFIIKTTNGGSTWVQQNTGTIPFPNGIDFVNATNGFVVGDAGMILATTNGGTTWNSQTSGTTDTLQDVSFISTSIGWTCGFAGTIRKTINGGVSWTGEASGTTVKLHGIFALDSCNIWIVGDNGTIKKKSCSTGTGSILNSDVQIRIFPIPLTDNSTISIESNVILKDAAFYLYDEVGREVEKISITSYETTFSKSVLSPGIYNYSLLNQGSVIGKGRLVIQ